MRKIIIYFGLFECNCLAFQHTVTEQWRTFFHRLLQLHCWKDRNKKSFLQHAITLYHNRRYSNYKNASYKHFFSYDAQCFLQLFFFFLKHHNIKSRGESLKLPERRQNDADGCKLTCVTRSGADAAHTDASGVGCCLEGGDCWGFFWFFFYCCELSGSSVVIQKVFKTSPRTVVNPSTLLGREQLQN